MSQFTLADWFGIAFAILGVPAERGFGSPTRRGRSLAARIAAEPDETSRRSAFHKYLRSMTMRQAACLAAWTIDCELYLSHKIVTRDVNRADWMPTPDVIRLYASCKFVDYMMGNIIPVLDLSSPWTPGRDEEYAMFYSLMHLLDAACDPVFVARCEAGEMFVRIPGGSFSIWSFDRKFEPRLRIDSPRDANAAGGALRSGTPRETLSDRRHRELREIMMRYAPTNNQKTDDRDARPAAG